MHKTLEPRTNVGLLVVWGVVVAAGALTCLAAIWPALMVAVVMGIGGGTMQARVLRGSGRELAAAETMLQIRKVLTQSRWGRGYLWTFWLGMVTVFATSLATERGWPVGWLVGYAAFAFAREAITLPGTFALRRFSDHT